MQLSISVALLPKLLPTEWAGSHAIAVVIDTLRFTSTACVALAAGAQGVTVVSDIEQARQTAARLPAGSALLCGERACVRIPGFDLGNSPAEYIAGTVDGRELVFSTTNGTVAVEASQAASEVVLGSLLNRSALCQWLGELPQRFAASNDGPIEIWCVCAGTDGEVALEDVLTAGAIVERLVALRPDCRLGNDASALALAAWTHTAAMPPRSPSEQSLGPGILRGLEWDEAGEASLALPSRLVHVMRTALGGRNLVEAGFAEDLRLVASVDSLTDVPRQEQACRFVR